MRLEQLESRASPVSISLDFDTFGFNFDPARRWALQAYADDFGRLMDRVLQPYVGPGVTQFGAVPDQPDSVWRVFVGTTSDPTVLATGAPGYNFNGGSVALGANVAWSSYDLGTTFRHELGHTMGLQHSNDPASLMFAYQSPGVVKWPNTSDYGALTAAGWNVSPPFGYPTVVPYPGFGGATANIALGDINGDGVPDVVTGAAAGGAPHVRAFSGIDGKELLSFYAYAPSFTGGVSVAAGDGWLATGAGPGGAPHVRVWNGSGVEVRGFYATDASYTGGVKVAGVGNKLYTSVNGWVAAG